VKYLGISLHALNLILRVVIVALAIYIAFIFAAQILGRVPW